MDLFPDGAFVRLQCRANSKYVHADGDWDRVSLRPSGAAPSLNSVWRVEHWFSEAQGVTFVLLQSAAYGRYLSFSIRPAPLGHRGRRTTQRDRNEPNVLQDQNSYPWMWRAERLDPPDQDYVGLRYFDYYLRANGRHITWNIDVTTDAVNPAAPPVTTMMHWTVHEVEASPVPRPLPVTLQRQGGRRRGVVFWRRTGIRVLGMAPHPPRTIRHVRATDEGDFDQNHHNWPSFASYDCSLIDLKRELGPLQHDWNEDVSAYTLCMRQGSHGRLMPLVTDLSRSLDPLYIVVFRTGSPAAAALVYPAPPPPADAAAA